MMQEDSNGESTFEFVEKKVEDLSISSETTKTDSSSSLSSLVPPVGSSNLLTSIAPPSALPSFINPPSTEATVNPVTTNAPTATSHSFHPTTFSPVIPASKGMDSTSPTTPVPLDPATSSAGDAGGGLLGWMKGAVGTSGGLLSKVAERAKNSVDSMITTLDPQMREFLYSGGDVDIVVASDKEVKISPVREAFQAVFGKATVTGVAAQSISVSTQPVGFESGINAAKERISSTRASGKLHKMQPILAVENFIVEVVEDKWYDTGVLLLHDPVRELSLHVFTQLTPVPASVVSVAQADTPDDYPLRSSGLSVTVGSLMGNNLQTAEDRKI
ncbi:unnamed protein product [Timema podura]|uniref:Non-canonical purine NTP phosphatase/PRRC1 domain-containing protein n=1 Tax=Timema podura TaxID=61482 RepID=A0ABN7NNP4_TIMPD|nr:unnamed protein product [Timema podura]